MAAALRLRARGYEVTLFEQLERLGGRAQVYDRKGFVFDAGPTVVTAPFLFEELFQLFDRRLEDYLTLLPVEPWYQFLFPDGEIFCYGGTVEDTLTEIERLSPEDRSGYLNLVRHSQRIFDVGFSQLAHVPFHSFLFMLTQVPALLRLGGYLTVYQLTGRYLKDERLRRAFSIQPLLVGGNPCSTTCIYSMIHYLERKWGVFFPQGGTGALVDGLARLATDVGIEVRLNSAVSEVLVRGGRARGVLLANGDRLDADLVVCNADPPTVYRKMLPAQVRRKWTDRRVDSLHYSMGLFVLYFGTTRRYPEVEHHTIIMGERFQGLLDDIFKHQVLAEDFSLYLHRPTATDPSMAPDGCDTFYVLSPVPNLQAGIDWSQEGPKYRDRVVKALEQTLLPGLSDCMVEDFYFTPETFRDHYGTHFGTGFSIAPLLTQSAYFRFHNRSEDVEDLYFVGAGTHPGAGLPGVVCSAKVLDSVVPDPLEEPGARIQRYGKTFWWASHFLEPTTRRQAIQLYSLCRTIDDWADQNAPAESVLGALLEQLRNGPQGFTAEIVQLSQTAGFDPRLFEKLIEGALQDQGEVRMESTQALLRYCYHVAGTVGLMMAPILGAKEPAAQPFALDLGVAMQLTNICRDVREDALDGRVYLPAELTQGPLDPQKLVERDPDSLGRAEQAVRKLLNLAELYYASASAGFRFIPWRNRLAIQVAARLYRAIGCSLASRPSREFFSRRSVVSGLRKAWETLLALGQVVPRGSHNPELHRPLEGLPGAAA